MANEKWEKLRTSKQDLHAFYDAFFAESKIRDLKPGNVNVGTTSTVVLPGNTGRVYLALCNDSSSKIYIGVGTAAAWGVAPPLISNGGVLEMPYFMLHFGTINAIAAIASANLTYWEGVR